MNLPNRLTVLRAATVPFFVAVLLAPGIPNHFLWAWLLFAGASLTDHFDGRIARSRNQITNFGKFLDPLADKILVVSALICLLALGLADVWAVLLIIAREFVVTSIRLVAADSGVVIAANRWGKTKTVSQMTAILTILALQFVQELVRAGSLAPFTAAGMESAAVFAAVGEVLIWISAFFAVLSGIIYIKQNIHVINTVK